MRWAWATGTYTHETHSLSGKSCRWLSHWRAMPPTHSALDEATVECGGANAAIAAGRIPLACPIGAHATALTQRPLASFKWRSASAFRSSLLPPSAGSTSKAQRLSSSSEGALSRLIKQLHLGWR